MNEFRKVCQVSDLVSNSGVAALIESQQVALFYVEDEVFALSNYDPVGQANVLSRGMVGDLKGELMVASPLQKQHYSLKTGICLDDETVSISKFETKIENQSVWVKL
ncbi:nitrite reductase (NAD(P)H) small subunit [Hydrogenovibrio sp. SC-1]|uniref:nitrite reductase small subunit NirD n=1 Tax=Hydrogenovibrio sp. SC-1 TaxID=2065820 RepID=UPI000C7A69BF|nr:nitrite reductase small subunit NirD [Hydrogenovibrio sp. SC-1]PLA74965.1 nitrite reductase (NAD(P)H) small subunit [Hydrogenovibrio sp. SC-1]